MLFVTKVSKTMNVQFLCGGAVVAMNLGLDLDYCVDEERDDCRLVGSHRFVHSGYLVASVRLDSVKEKIKNVNLKNCF